MKNNSITFIGLDMHKAFTEIAYCEGHRGDNLMRFFEGVKLFG